MAMNISFNAGSSGSYGSINKNNAQYKAAAKDYLANHRAEVARMSPLERQMYELFGGEQAYMRNVMKPGTTFYRGRIILPAMPM